MRKKVSLVLLGSLLLNACASNGSEHSRTPSAKKAQSQDGPGKWQLAVKAPAQQVKKLPKKSLWQSAAIQGEWKNLPCDGQRRRVL